MSELTQCDKCGYKWPYSGEMDAGAWVTCPQCRNKTQYQGEADA